MWKFSTLRGGVVGTWTGFCTLILGVSLLSMLIFPQFQGYAFPLLVVVLGIQIGLLLVHVARERSTRLSPARDQLDQFILENLIEGVCVVDTEGHVRFMNSAAKRLLGSEITKIPLDETYDTWASEHGIFIPNGFSTIEKLKQPLLAAANGLNRMTTELYITNANMPEGGRLLLATASAVQNHKHELTATLVSLHDITEKKRSDRNAKLSEELFRLAFSSNPAPMAVTSIEDGKFIDANDKFLKLFGYGRDELIGQTSFELNIWPDLNERNRLARSLSNTGSLKDLDVHIRTKDGKLRNVSASFELVHWQGKACVLGMANDITQRKEYEASLREAKRAADNSNRTKSEFLANMSHEMRTPLNAISGYLEMLYRSLISSVPTDAVDSKIHYIHRAQFNLEHLLSLISDILDLTKVEAGKLEVEKISFSLLEELAPLLLQLQSQAERKGLSMDVQFVDPIPERIESDPNRLRQILTNVVGNAIKFTDNGSILVSVSMTSDHNCPRLNVQVTDTGCGLNGDQKDRIFESFCQGDTSITRKYGGTGLGLTLSRRLSRELGGDLILIRSEPGQGSTFQFDVETGPISTVSQISNANLFKFDVARSEQRQRRLENIPNLNGVNVLLVEDGEDNQEVISFFLQQAGISVEIAENGEQALRMVEKHEGYQLILMDVQMPVLGGKEATKKLRAKGCKIPIIALSAVAIAQERSKYLHYGFDDYLVKPIEPHTLMHTISLHLQANRQGAIPITRHQQRRNKMPENTDSPLYSIYANDPRVKPVIQGFVKRLPLRVDSLKRALSSNNWEELASVAHQIKGAAGGYGFPKLTEIAKSIEESAKDGTPKEARLEPLIAEFAKQCERAAQAI